MQPNKEKYIIMKIFCTKWTNKAKAQEIEPDKANMKQEDEKV